MNNSVSFDDFLYYVSSFFDFVIKDYGYSFYESKDMGTLYQYNYIKDDNIIRIVYSKKNAYLEVIFFKNVFVFSPTSQDGVNSLSLDYVIMRKLKKRNIDELYNSSMPSSIGFMNSCIKISNLLKEFGQDVLIGKKWKGWQLE